MDEPVQQADKGIVCTYSNVERLEAVARCSTERHDLGTRVGNADLEIAIGVFLLEDNSDGLLDVDEEPTRSGYSLFVV